MEWSKEGVIAIGTVVLFREMITGILKLRRNGRNHNPPCDELKELRKEHYDHNEKNQEIFTQLKVDMKEIKTHLKYLVENQSQKSK